MHRFFVQSLVLSGADVTLAADVVYQIRRVLRMRPGEVVVLFDGTGTEYHVRLTEFGEEQVRGEVVERSAGVRDPVHAVHLYLGLLNKPDKFEWALQKCTELGAASFTPVICERSVAGAPEQGRRERWQRIIKEAAEQSGRCVLPLLRPTLEFRDAAAREAQRVGASAPNAAHVPLIPALGAGLSIAQAIDGAAEAASVSLFIGPEGGFTDDELVEAKERGIQIVGLGPRTLRSETAAVAALTLAMQALGELG
jgi:16S rRNA (uracil1498-N3)-methyltransferase